VEYVFSLGKVVILSYPQPRSRMARAGLVYSLYFVEG